MSDNASGQAPGFTALPCIKNMPDDTHEITVQLNSFSGSFSTARKQLLNTRDDFHISSGLNIYSGEQPCWSKAAE